MICRICSLKALILASKMFATLQSCWLRPEIGKISEDVRDEREHRSTHIFRRI